MLIKDQTGRVIEGVRGKLKTLAITMQREAEASLAEDTYFASTVDQDLSLTTSVAREVLMLITNNEPSRDLVITKLFVSAANPDGIFVLHKNPTLATLGANTPGTPHNLNFGSAKVPAVDIQIWDETGTGISGVTVTEDINSYIVGQSLHSLPVDEAFVIPPGRTIGIDQSGVVTEVSVAIRFIMQDSGLLTPSTV